MAYVPIPGIPERLRALRSRSGWSLATVSRRTGYSKGALGDLEAGRKNPSLHQLMALAQCYGASETWILHGGD